MDHICKVSKSPRLPFCHKRCLHLLPTLGGTTGIRKRAQFFTSPSQKGIYKNQKEEEEEVEEKCLCLIFGGWNCENWNPKTKPGKHSRAEGSLVFEAGDRGVRRRGGLQALASKIVDGSLMGIRFPDRPAPYSLRCHCNRFHYSPRRKGLILFFFSVLK